MMAVGGVSSYQFRDGNNGDYLSTGWDGWRVRMKMGGIPNGGGIGGSAVGVGRALRGKGGS